MIETTQSTVLDRYELLRSLGQGAYGAVYEARDRTTGEHVALKELTEVNAASLAQFKHEFRALQEVHHPNLVRLDALFEDHGKWTIAMELVPGSNLLDYLYNGQSDLAFDEMQLRAAFLQLAEGLNALHTAGLLHRDLKPSNVRVTPEGRAVLLDFGLTTALDPKGQSTRMNALGTVAYMAPEQAAAEKLGPAADWYAFGVCLYEALTGVLPVNADSPLLLLLAKQKAIPAPASSLTSGIPEDLDRLCVALLAIAPQARPDGASVRKVLARRSPSRSVRPAPRSMRPDGAAAFEGRAQELAVLGQAFERVRSGAQQVVLVEGDSGIGKSALIEHFVNSLQLEHELLVLRSRCYENELLAYKAFDGAVDGLARILAKLDAAACRELLPPRAALLCRLFPALSAIKVLATAPMGDLAADPGVQRLEAFSVFARLFAKLTERRPIVLAIDDLQWADAESFRLLSVLLEAPLPMRCLILATVRPQAELESEAATGVEALRRLGCVSDLPLTGLPPAHARNLARELMGPAIPDSWLEIIVRESAGHPLFLTVLTRFAESHDPKTAADLTLDAAIGARIGNLSSKARKLLETVAVVGSPLATSLCGRAAEFSESELGPAVADLCRQKLLRRRRAGELACFHDRIRRVAVECLPRAQLREMHAQVARVFSSSAHADSAELARHYEAAGEPALAYEAYRRAAEKALASLAFARAAGLYARAIEQSATLELAPVQRSALKREHGHALARSGHSTEAARRYLEAAQDAEGEDQTRLRIWAAQHLLQNAHVEEGMHAARTLLDELGVPLPSSAAAAWARMKLDHAWLSVRGLGVSRASAPIPVRMRMQLDALWELGLPVAWIEASKSAALGTQHLRLACSAGDPPHMVRALSEAAFARTIQDPLDATVDKLLARARMLCDEVADPTLEVLVSFREGAVALRRWDLFQARERLEHAQSVATQSCPDQPWLLTNVRTLLGTVLLNAGEHAVLASSCSRWLAEARDRNDQFALTMLDGLGYGCVRHLMADQPERARAALEASLAPWPREPFSYAHYGELLARSYTELYGGGDGAQRWFAAEMSRLSQASLLRYGMFKASWWIYRGYACLAAHNVATADRSTQCIAEARSATQQLKRSDLKYAATHALSLEAQLAACVGDLASALDKARQGTALSQGCGHFFAACTFTYLEGLLESGDAGKKKQATSLAFLAGQGWKNPRRGVAALCPVIDHLEAQR